MLLGFENAAERLRNEVAFKGGCVFRWSSRWDASGFREHVDEAENEETGKGAAKVRDAGE